MSFTRRVRITSSPTSAQAAAVVGGADIIFTEEVLAKVPAPGTYYDGSKTLFSRAQKKMSASGSYKKSLSRFPTKKEFHSLNPFIQRRTKDQALNLIRSQFLSQKESLKNIFQKIDKRGNENGLIERNELREGFRHANIRIPDDMQEVVFRAFDSDHSGHISYMEFVHAVLQPMHDRAMLKLRRYLKETLTMDHLHRGFQHYDYDGSGRIDRKEFVSFMRDKLHVTCVRPIELDTLFDIFDSDHDGSISYWEFVYTIFNKRPQRAKEDSAVEDPQSQAEIVKDIHQKVVVPVLNLSPVQMRTNTKMKKKRPMTALGAHSFVAGNTVKDEDSVLVQPRPSSIQMKYGKKPDALLSKRSAKHKWPLYRPFHESFNGGRRYQGEQKSTLERVTAIVGSHNMKQKSRTRPQSAPLANGFMPWETPRLSEEEELELVKTSSEASVAYPWSKSRERVLPVKFKDMKEYRGSFSPYLLHGHRDRLLAEMERDFRASMVVDEDAT